MRIPAKCPKCSKKFKVEEESIGKKGRCPACQSQFVVAEEKEFPPPLQETFVDSLADVKPNKRIGNEPHENPISPVVGTRHLVMMGFAGVAVGVLLTLLVGSILSPSGRGTPVNATGQTDATRGNVPKRIVLPARRKFQHSFSIEENVDRFKGTTTYYFLADVDEVPFSSIILKVLVDNRSSTSIETVIFEFSSVSQSWQYTDIQRLNFLVDNQPLSLECVRKGTKRDMAVHESITAHLGLDEFITLINAKRSEVQIGRAEFELSNEHIEAMRDVASRLSDGKTLSGKFDVSHEAK